MDSGKRASNHVRRPSWRGVVDRGSAEVGRGRTHPRGVVDN